VVLYSSSKDLVSTVLDQIKDLLSATQYDTGREMHFVRYILKLENLLHPLGVSASMMAYRECACCS